ncbi:MAG: response regulator [Gammaproteobacteria bacterium]|nr:response regulator [Gammaproteobacteria bacterium]MBT8443713.1 response regulator [Gammaproteobacteria bacterium]NND36597.1 response regulator transcription factor [Gammaproteobacteria bacterium]
MSEQQAMVCVVDDDASVRKALRRLLTGAGYTVETYASAAEFLASEPSAGPSCAVLDLAMPGMDGLELQERLAERDLLLGIVFLTGHGDIPASVRAMKHGAVDFLTKPVDEDDLLGAIDAALVDQHILAESRDANARVRDRFVDLTARERDVMERVVTGLLNKQIAGALGISEKTVKAHRARVMQKTGARSLAELVQLHIAANLDDG